MNHFLRALWDRLLPSGGDVARTADDREAFIPGGRPLRVCWLGYRPEPQPMGDLLADSAPRLNDLSPGGHCWWWNDPQQSWELTHHEVLDLGDLWLPYHAIADPSTDS